MVLLVLKQQPIQSLLYESPSEFRNPLTTDRWRMRVYPAYISVIGIYYVFSLVKEERYECRQYG